MKQRDKLLRRYRIIIYMMLAIFVSAPFFQAFHAHETTYNKNAHGMKVLNNDEPDCQFCHHFAHQQTSPLLPLAVSTFVFFENTPAIATAHHAIGLVTLPGLSWTNKGPPVLAA